MKQCGLKTRMQLDITSFRLLPTWMYWWINMFTDPCKEKSRSLGTLTVFEMHSNTTAAERNVPVSALLILTFNSQRLSRRGQSQHEPYYLDGNVVLSLTPLLCNITVSPVLWLSHCSLAKYYISFSKMKTYD